VYREEFLVLKKKLIVFCRSEPRGGCRWQWSRSSWWWGASIANGR